MIRINTSLKISLLLTICVSLTVIPALSQSRQPARTAFDSIFYHTYTNTASIDLDYALEVADSLYRTSVTDIHKVRSLMLISDMHHRMANRDSTIHYALRAERIATRAMLYEWQTRISGVLSTQYRMTGLLKQGRRFLEKGLQASKKIENPRVAAQFSGHVYQEKGYYAIEEESHQEAISLFQQAAVFFRKLPDSPERAFFMVQNEERLGKCYLQLQAYDSARYHYVRALDFSDKASEEETPLKGFAYQGLGQVYLELGNDSAAHKYLGKALAVADASGFPGLQIEVYKSLARYYKAVNDIENYILYNEKYLKTAEENTLKHRRYADNILSRTQKNLEQMTASRKAVLLAGIAVLLMAVPGAIFYRNKQRRNYQRFRQVIRELRGRVPVPEPAVQEEARAGEKVLMPRKTEEMLLAKLRHFEYAGEFREKGISIPVLAAKMETNTKYLSHLIRKHRGKDFSTYINELRIRYIMGKMQDDPLYLRYKISYLAEECGFSSHSKFSTVFKEVAGLSPSTFISYLKKDRDK